MIQGIFIGVFAVCLLYRFLKPVREVFEKHVGPRPPKPPNS
jgi:hypothetical protein